LTIFAPIPTRDGALLIGVGLDQTRIDCKAFATNQVGRDTCLHDSLEYPTENMPLPEALVAGT
jgi:hypothetical protein